MMTSHPRGTTPTGNKYLKERQNYMSAWRWAGLALAPLHTSPSWQLARHGWISNGNGNKPKLPVEKPHIMLRALHRVSSVPLIFLHDTGNGGWSVTESSNNVTEFFPLQNSIPNFISISTHVSTWFCSWLLSTHINFLPTLWSENYNFLFLAPVMSSLQIHTQFKACL